MANERELKDLFDATAFDNAGEKLGSIKEIFVDDNTGQPTFVEVGHGLFGLSSSWSRCVVPPWTAMTSSWPSPRTASRTPPIRMRTAT